MRIALITTTLTQGGAQRVAATLANCWTQKGHTVQTVTYEAPGTQPDFPLDQRVALAQIDLMPSSATLAEATAKNIRRILRIRQILGRFSPDVAVGFITGPNVLAVLAGLGKPWPTIISERVHPAHDPIGQAWSWMRRTVYPKADAIVVQSADISQWFRDVLGLETQIVPNPIDLEKFAPAMPIAIRRPRYSAMAAGRLEPQKGYDILIEAFARVASSNPQWDLVIYGMGQQRQDLERRIAAFGMRDRIVLAGHTLDIAKAYGNADLFVHPARYEGYPNVVQEALAAGRPVIATDCPGYSAELLGRGRYGIVVPTGSVDALAKALAELLPDHERRLGLAARARSAVTAFESTTIADRWLVLFEESIRRRGRYRDAAMAITP